MLLIYRIIPKVINFGELGWETAKTVTSKTYKGLCMERLHQAWWIRIIHGVELNPSQDSF
jgi:hypothetical protein